MVTSDNERSVRDEATPSATRGALVLYLLPLILVPYLLLVIAVFLIPSQWLAVRSHNTYLANLGYGATLHDANCQIVVYGDSTAMVGIDPAILQKRTSLSACNIAEFEGMTILNGMMVVDQYMAQNQRPKYIVFLYTPEDFQGESQRHMVGMFESLTWRFGQPHKLANVAAMMKHPDEFFDWAEQGLRLAAQHLVSKPMALELAHYREQHGGQLANNSPTMTSCEGMDRPDSTPDQAWISGLRTRYGRDGTAVLIDSTPMPACDPKFAYFQNHLSSLVDNGIQTMPLNSFTKDGRLHVNAAGSVVLSNIVADQILQRMSHDTADAPGAH